MKLEATFSFLLMFLDILAVVDEPEVRTWWCRIDSGPITPVSGPDLLVDAASESVMII
jgi:hypothetical protein